MYKSILITNTFLGGESYRELTVNLSENRTRVQLIFHFLGCAVVLVCKCTKWRNDIGDCFDDVTTKDYKNEENVLIVFIYLYIFKTRLRSNVKV